MATYTYTIYDVGAGVDSPWGTHTGREIDADDDDDAVARVRDALARAAHGVSSHDGYGAGDTLRARVWGADGTVVGRPTYTLADDDVVDECDE